MGKYTHPDILEGFLEDIATATRLFLCSAQPATYLEASDDYMLASETLTPGDGNGDFTIEDDPVSGKRLMITQKADITVTNTGTANHYALCDHNNTKLLSVGELTTPIALTAENTVTFPAGEIDDIAEPV